MVVPALEGAFLGLGLRLGGLVGGGGGEAVEAASGVGVSAAIGTGRSGMIEGVVRRCWFCWGSLSVSVSVGLAS